MRKVFLSVALVAAFLFAQMSVVIDPVHATVSTTENTKTYTGNGTTDEFSFPYLVYATSHLAVTIDGVSTSAYTLSGIGNQAGVTLTFTTAPANGTAIIIQRIVPYDQQTDFENFDGNPADVTEKQFDLLAMQTQQIDEQLNRSILAPIGTTLTTNTITGTIDSTVRALTITTAGPASSTLASVSSTLDTALTGLASGDYLRYDGSNWLNDTAAETVTALGVPGLALANTFSGSNVFSANNTFSGDVVLSGSQVREVKGADVASGTALAILSDGNLYDVTGTSTITSINTSGTVGTQITLQFDGVVTLTHHATDLILPGAANIATAAGDTFTFREYASGDWICTGYTLATGKAIVETGNAPVLIETQTASNDATIEFTTGINSTYASYEIRFTDVVGATNGAAIYMRTSSDGGSSFDSSSGNYEYSGWRSTGVTLEGIGTSSSNTTVITSGNSNNAGFHASGVITLYNPSNSSVYTGFTAQSVFWDSGTSTIRSVGIAGARQDAADVDAIQFLMATGNITSGTFKLYGIP